MSYELSFSEIFFVCLERAIACIDDNAWQDMIDDEDLQVSEHSDVQDVATLAREVNTCNTIAARTPIGVYIDEGGYYKVEVMPLAHYVKHNPEICGDDDQALVFIHEDWCWCPECAGCPSMDWSRERVQEYLEGRGFAVRDSEPFTELLEAAREDWLSE